ncbi:ZPR1-type zinc finger-containing protein [Tieghemostelium lacteum]|uniref:ZPR1-type zinc finger-containing protein n=1 Tax=Tieghemostelium lacteum TaxID=361077 RepID=A0A151Z9Z8_TIELA|nr:ZPR1-type zinc finger-containing protein [Tieghemostelium lacteum]|eukprot:KYQ90767.1 ZPR1-type zinc finger-containing protein [Tieghemostelium lacteum]
MSSSTTPTTTTTTTTTSTTAKVEDEKHEEFKEISSENNTIEEIQSLCMNCRSEDGLTRIMLTKVPFFKEILIYSFNCPECGFTSNEIRHGGSIEIQGIHIELMVHTKLDLNRQVIKMDSASISIPSLDFEIPAQTQKGSLNTIEGILSASISDLQSAVENLQRLKDEENAVKVGNFVQKLQDLIEMKSGPFTLVLHDPSGNSYIENPTAPKADPNLVITHFERTKEDNEGLGLGEQRKLQKAEIPTNLEDREVLELPNDCSFCGAPGNCKMVVTDIPYFKQIVLMAFTCDQCGYKNNEIKAGGAISEKGKTLTLKVESIEDLSRDVLKSDTANAIIPEIDLEITHGSLGGKFTTVEGLVTAILQELDKNPFFTGDSSDPKTRQRFAEVTKALETFISGEVPFTLIIDDPISNSYIQNLYAPDPDPNLTEVEYERTYDQNEELGLNAMKTENYEDEEENDNQEDDEDNQDNQQKDEDHKEN